MFAPRRTFEKCVFFSLRFENQIQILRLDFRYAKFDDDAAAYEIKTTTTVTRRMPVLDTRELLEQKKK